MGKSYVAHTVEDTIAALQKAAKSMSGIVPDFEAARAQLAEAELLLDSVQLYLRKVRAEEQMRAIVVQMMTAEPVIRRQLIQALRDAEVSVSAGREALQIPIRSITGPLAQAIEELGK